jgi:hypothetical protein
MFRQFRRLLLQPGQELFHSDNHGPDSPVLMTKRLAVMTPQFMLFR